MNETMALLVVNAGTLVAVLAFGYKIVRFINRIEFKTDILWTDYERRMQRIVGPESWHEKSS